MKLRIFYYIWWRMYWILGKPAAPSNCAIHNQTADSVRVDCQEAFDGGLQQTFGLELVDRNKGTLRYVFNNTKPVFTVYGLVYYCFFFSSSTFFQKNFIIPTPLYMHTRVFHSYYITRSLIPLHFSLHSQSHPTSLSFILIFQKEIFKSIYFAISAPASSNPFS